MVNARSCKKAGLAFFFGRWENCETDSSKCVKCELEIFRLQ